MVTFDGFRLVVIGDLHEQPILHIKTKRFVLGANDWSGEVRLEMFFERNDLSAIQFQASTTMAASISYWNIFNSHWEPRKVSAD
jgi:vacuolar protein sorting-associated protein 13A/C